jgi:dUTPase
LSLKRGLVLANSEGVIDVDYQNEVFVMMTNISEVTQTIKRYDRMAQAEVVANIPFNFVEIKDVPKPHSERSGGFGSTG